MQRCKLLIVDDSALMRQLLTQILSSDPAIEIVGTASDPYVAKEKIKTLRPDILTLDIEMPRMDGLTFLEKLMRAHPMPVVMISSLTERGAETTLKALSLGAVDYIPKPKLDIASQTVELSAEIIAKVKAAARAKLRQPRAAAFAPSQRQSAANELFPFPNRVVAIGASTGGPEALQDVLEPLPANFPGVVIVQHMPETFTGKFAERLDSLCNIRVREAQDGDLVTPGLALLAPGGRQMTVLRQNGETRIRLHPGTRVNHHAPSVDVLFSSCAQQLGREAVGVLLTGMGADGAKGLLEMKQAHAFTIAQDEASCVVFGMPKEAIALGAVETVLPLARIPSALVQKLREVKGTASQRTSNLVEHYIS